MTLYGTETPAQPGDPLAAGASIKDGPNGGTSVVGDELGSKNEVDIPRQVTFPRDGNSFAGASSAGGESGFGEGRVGVGSG